MKIGIWIIGIIISFVSTGSFAEEFPANKTLVCKEKNHGLIRGYESPHDKDEIAKEINILLCDGTSINPSKPQEQGGISNPQISGDQKSIGWIIETYCCSSGLNPSFVNIYQEGKIYSIAPKFGISLDWSFSKMKDRILIKAGFAHGSEESSYDEYDIKTGKIIKHIKDEK